MMGLICACIQFASILLEFLILKMIYLFSNLYVECFAYMSVNYVHVKCPRRPEVGVGPVGFESPSR